MSVENKNRAESHLEQELTRLAAQSVKLAKLVLLRGAVMLSRDAVTPDQLADLIPTQRTPENPPLEIEVRLRRAEVLKNCQAAFDFAVATQIDSADNYILPAPYGVYKSEYVCIASQKSTPLYLHRPTVFNDNRTRYAFWMREKVCADEANLNLPTYYYREYGIDAQGNIEEKLTLEDKSTVYRPLDDYEALPYYRSLTPVLLRAMSQAVILSEISDS